MYVTLHALGGTPPKYTAVARELKQFLQWYSTPEVSPNITVLGMDKKVVVQNEKGQGVMLDQNN